MRRRSARCPGWPTTRKWWRSAKRASTTTTTTRRAPCNRRRSADSSTWPAGSSYRLSSTSVRQTSMPSASCARRELPILEGSSTVIRAARRRPGSSWTSAFTSHSAASSHSRQRTRYAPQPVWCRRTGYWWKPTPLSSHPPLIVVGVTSPPWWCAPLSAWQRYAGNWSTVMPSDSEHPARPFELVTTE